MIESSITLRADEVTAFIDKKNTKKYFYIIIKQFHNIYRNKKRCQDYEYCLQIKLIILIYLDNMCVWKSNRVIEKIVGYPNLERHSVKRLIEVWGGQFFFALRVS